VSFLRQEANESSEEMIEKIEISGFRSGAHDIVLLCGVFWGNMLQPSSP
jgi:hypothetical protein